MPEISIITALHNCVDLTRAYVDSLILNTESIDWELILVDDASSDGTAEYLKEIESDSRIRIVSNKENMGFSASNNRGAAVATADVLAFLNNDLILSPNWLPPMLETLKLQEKAGIVGNIQTNPHTGLLDHAGVFFGLDGMPRQARKNRKQFPKVESTEWYAVTAACMLMRTELFKEVGGFDEAYRNGFEDIDLCVKTREMGYRHYVSNQSVIVHCVSASPGRHNHNDSNSNIFEKRWAETTKVWGEFDWAPEYLQRYARHWWKFNLGKLLKALKLVIMDRKDRRMIYRA